VRQNLPQKPGSYIKVGMSSCGVAAGAQRVYDALKEEAEKRRIDIAIKPCGCMAHAMRNRWLKWRLRECRLLLRQCYRQSCAAHF